jgi:hypothetical protein
VLFPAFAHTYLALIELGASGEAQQLMAAQRSRFLDAAAGGSTLRAQVGGRDGGRPHASVPQSLTARRSAELHAQGARVARLLACHPFLGPAFNWATVDPLACAQPAPAPSVSAAHPSPSPAVPPPRAPPLPPPPSPFQELRDLAGITAPEGIAASRTAAALRSRRIAIRLCRASYDLLAQHLQQPRQMVVLGIVNEHLAFEVGGGAVPGSTL